MVKKITLLAMAVAGLLRSRLRRWQALPYGKQVGSPLAGRVQKIRSISRAHSPLTKGGLKISCTATANADLWNEGGVGVGLVNSLTLTADPVGTAGCTVARFVSPNYVDVANCHVQASSEKFPWSITTSGTSVSITGANFTNEFNGCGALGIPNGTKVKAEGTVKGVGEGNCITFTEAGEIPETKIDGSLCATSGVLSLG